MVPCFKLNGTALVIYRLHQNIFVTERTQRKMAVCPIKDNITTIPHRRNDRRGSPRFRISKTQGERGRGVGVMLLYVGGVAKGAGGGGPAGLLTVTWVFRGPGKW